MYEKESLGIGARFRQRFTRSRDRTLQPSAENMTSAGHTVLRKHACLAM